MIKNIDLTKLKTTVEQQINRKIILEETGTCKMGEVVISFAMQGVTAVAKDVISMRHGLEHLRTLAASEVGTYEQIRLQPKQFERGLMLDIGRKYYSPEMLKELVDYMATLKMNALQLHFSENEGFRIECSSFPQITSPEFLTKKEVEGLIDYAEERGILVIPEFDSPGHLKHLLTFFPEWKLSNEEDGTQLIPANRGIDITNGEAVEAVKKIIAEYIALFSSSPYFHIGADEYVQFESLHKYNSIREKSNEAYGNEYQGYDLFMAYVNDLVQYVKGYGKKVRVWNDGFYKKNLKAEIQLDPSVQVTYWTKHDERMAEVGTFIEKGHELINFNDNFFYFVLGEAASYKYPTAEKIAEQWDVNLFAQQQFLSSSEMKHVVGTYFAIWSDCPASLSEEQVLAKIREPLKSQQEKLWSVTYTKC